MSIRVIVMDVDGTLIELDGIIPPKTKEALLKAQRNGIRLVLASGRPINGMLDLASELEMDKHHGLCICFNGSKVYDVQTNEVLYDQLISVPECKQVLHHMKQFDVVPVVMKDNYMYVENVFNCMIRENGKDLNILEYESHGNHYLLCEVPDLEEFLNFELNKILCYGEPKYLQDHYQLMAQPFNDSLNSMFTAPIYYEFTAKDVDKAKALETVLSNMGYKQEEMIAFGDAQNDISMVKFAGLGIAMGNAIAELKAVADHVTDSCKDNGIANALYKFKVI